MPLRRQTTGLALAAPARAMEDTMAPVQKKKTYRSLKFTSPKSRNSHTRELLLTIGNGAVLKIETIEKSGRRRQVTEADLAELVGERRTDLGAALEHAYALGFADALEHE